VDETFSLVAMKAQTNHIVVDTKFESLTDDDTFDIDRGSLQTALVNILENGIEACIDDKAAKDKDHTITFQVRIDTEKVLFKIQDNGLGMDKATLKNIFTIFFSSKGNKGTGLGLFIANKVITQHRGDVKVVSTKNRGTKFIIKLPRSAPIRSRNLRKLPMASKT